MLENKQLRRIQQSGHFIVLVVYISVFLDNMLLSIVVPIIPDILYKLETDRIVPGMAVRNLSEENCLQNIPGDINWLVKMNNCSFRESELNNMNNENEEVGILLSSKALVQLGMNPIVGLVTNRMGSRTPMFCGTLMLILSSLMFAYGEKFSFLFAARSIHGIGSSCISIAGMTLIADRYPDDQQRSRVMGFIMGGIAAGVLVGYPCGSIMYDFVNKSAALLIVTGLLLLDSVFLLLVLRPSSGPETLLVGTRITKLMFDPYIMLSTGAISTATLTMAVLEPCLPIWLMESMSPPRWQLGTVFIPDSFGYLVGTNFFGEIALKYGRWLTAMISLFMIGVCAITIPLSTHVLQLVIPHFGLGLGIGIIDASLMPLLAKLVDLRYVAVYGSVYAIAGVAVCLAYSIGPLLGGYLVKVMGFPWVMTCLGILNILYCPLCYFFKNVPAIAEENVAIGLKSNGYMEAKPSPKHEGHRGYIQFSNED